MHCTGGQSHAGLSSGADCSGDRRALGLLRFTEQTLTTVDELTNDLALTRERAMHLTEVRSHGRKVCGRSFAPGEVLGAMRFVLLSFPEERISVFAQMLMRATSILRTQSNLFPQGSFLPS